MARIQPVSALIQIVPYTNVPDVTVVHNLGRKPFVEVFHTLTSGVFGFDDFGVGDFGVSSLDRALDDHLHEVVHIDLTTFKVVFANTFEGEIQYF